MTASNPEKSASAGLGVAGAGEGDARTRPPLLVFVHIPKTAGTTLTTVLSANEPGVRTRRGGNVFKGGGGIKRGVRFEGLLRNDGGQLDRARVLAGHFPLGIREHLPRNRDVRYLTLLREPVDRTLSHYFQTVARHAGSGGAKKLGLPPLPADATLDQALEWGYVHDNVQTRMLSGLPEPFGEVTEEMLERAKRNLREELVFFGLTERFDESLVLARRRLGLRSVLYELSARRGNGRSLGTTSGRVNTTRPRGADVPDQLLQAAERCNRYDVELYRCAQELFDAAPEREELEFEVELAALRAAKANGEIGLGIPAPAGFGGDEEAWRMLLGARATSLRHERELAELRALVQQLDQREEAVLELLRRIEAGGRSASGRDANTAMRVIQMLTPVPVEAFTDGTVDPKGPARRSARGSRHG